MAKFGNWETTGNFSGGFQGTTYFARRIDDESQKTYVLKSLKDLRTIHRFQKEVKAGLELNHPNILKIVDYDIEAKKPFLVSEYCSGGTLKKLDISKLSILDKLNIFLQICNAVGYAHSNNPQIIHRDLKPENIFFKEDGITPVVGDFGICFIDDEGERVTLVDEAVGARKYTAPELEEGRNDFITPAADVYSLGKILYWMLAGKIFDREKHRDENWDLTKDNKNPAFVFVNELLDRMIVQNPTERWEDAKIVALYVNSIIGKITRNAHPLDFNAPQECLYCGAGYYDKFLEADVEYQKKQFSFESARNFLGFDINKWQMVNVVLVCITCGNEQRFRPFYKGWGNSKWKGLLPKEMR